MHILLSTITHERMDIYKPKSPAKVKILFLNKTIGYNVHSFSQVRNASIEVATLCRPKEPAIRYYYFMA